VAQTIRPDSNVTQTGFTGGFAEIDESVASDVDYAWGNGGTQVLEVGLSNPGVAPNAARPVTVRFRVARVNSSGTVGDGEGTITITCAVYETGTLRATAEAVTTTGTWTSYSFSPDLSAVSNFDNLRLRFTVDGGGGTRGGAISWAEMEVDQAANWASTLSESSTPADSYANTANMVATLSESSMGGDTYVTASNANIHAFTRIPFGEIWFVIPTGDTASHTYVSFCVDETQRAQAPVWFKGTLAASAVIDDPQLGVDAPWSCLRIPESAGASLYSFDRRADGTSTVDWNITSSAFYVDEAERRVLIKRYYRDFEVQDSAVTLQILTYDFPAGSSIASPSLSIGTSDTSKDFRVSGRLMKMKFSGSGRCRLGKPAFDIVSMGER
jgi:hypothetical protein